jgi:conjugative relaxase-like TrwC/TraI family protein
MLSVGKLAPGQQEYYLETVARGAEEYYTGAKEAPGQWTGLSTARLGLAGEVDADALGLILESRDPASRERLTRAQGAAKIPGFDATFCAPKSVSLLFALGEPETSNEVRNAHDAAVAAALRVLEAEAARARRGRGGIERHVAEGFVGAAFRHRTSRAGDPHLHTHVLVANLVWCPDDGRWSALDARSLYGWAKTVGYLYEAQLRAELAHRLGVAWTPVTKGIADIDGIPKRVLRAFSRRRQEIEMHMEERGESGPRAAQRAAYATRTRKHDTPTESLLPEWRARAAALGLDDTALASLLHAGRGAARPEPGTPASEALFVQLASPIGLTARAASFGRREVLQAIAGRLPAGGTIDRIVELAEAFLASDRVVALGAPSGLRSSDVIRRADGCVVAVHVDEHRWTTPEMLATERAVINTAIDRQHDRAGVADPNHVEVAVAARPSLSHEQVRMVRQLTTSGAGVDAVEGVAGSGKTYALAAAHDAWRASEHRVVGCALAARVAAQLEQDTAIPSMTLDRLLRELERCGIQLDDRTVVVVDEAAMVGTRKLAQLFDHAASAGAKVALVGDHHQLPEIDAGGSFAGIHTRLQGGRLVENRRQIELWERHALAQLRDGDADTAFAMYERHGRVVHVDDTEQLRERLVDDWWAARCLGSHALMVASRNDDVDDLNRRARARLVPAGKLGQYDLIVGGRGFAVGDEILATRNDYRVGVFNGTRGVITNIDHDRGELRINADGRDVVLPPAYVAAGHVTHAYAVTFHKAQGITVRDTFVLADDTLDRERAYTGMSRGTHSNRLYITDAPDERAEERHASEPANDAVARARRQLGRTLAQSMAIDQLEPRPTPIPHRQGFGPDLGL